MPTPQYTIVRDMNPELVDAQFTTDAPEEADELLEMAHASRRLTKDAERWFGTLDGMVDGVHE